MFTLGTAAKHVGKSKPTISKAIKIDAFSKITKIGFVGVFTLSFMMKISIKPAIRATSSKDESCACNFIHHDNEEVEHHDECHRVATFLSSKGVIANFEK